MKNDILLPLLFLFFQISFGQNVDVKEIIGQVLNGTTPIENVNIINNTTQKSTASDENGMFSINVKIDDILVFSAINLDPIRRRITKDDLTNPYLKINMTVKEVELKEVIINENPNINAVNLGVISSNQKKYTPAERRLYTATSGGGIDGLINTISGRKVMLKKEIKVEKKERLLMKLKYLFEEDYYTERLKIKLEDIKGFQYYCIGDKQFVASLEAKNRTMSMFLITGLANEYLKILENEQ